MKHLSFSAWAFACLFAWTAHAQEYRGKTLVEAQLVTSDQTIVPGKPFLVGLHMAMAEGWHTYWTFSGEAGLPTNVEWDLPEGIQISPMLSPLPELKTEATGFRAYSYFGEVTHLFYLYPSPDLTPGQTITIGAKADWLVCEEPCIPGSAEFTLELTVGERGVSRSTEKDPRLAEALANLPRPAEAFLERVEIDWETKGDQIILHGRLTTPLPGKLVAFYPLPPADAFIEIPEQPVFQNSPDSLANDGGVVEFSVSTSVVSPGQGLSALSGVLVFENQETKQRFGFLL